MRNEFGYSARRSIIQNNKEHDVIMGSHGASPIATDPTINIRVSGKLFQGHLSYLDQLIQSAGECCLWPQLILTHLEELDRAALLYLIRGEHQRFSIVSCPGFVREWMEHEKERVAA